MNENERSTAVLYKSSNSCILRIRLHVNRFTISDNRNCTIPCGASEAVLIMEEWKNGLLETLVSDIFQLNTMCFQRLCPGEP